MPTLYRSIVGFGLVLTVLLIAGCNGQVTPGPGVSSSSSFTSSSEDPPEQSVMLYFYSDADVAAADFQNPVVVSRSVIGADMPETMDRALKLLFAGPTQEEEQTIGAKTSDDLTALGPLYIGVRVEGSVAHVNFRPTALSILNSAAARQMMVKEPIERTVMQFPGVTEVRYEIDGNPFDEWDA